MCTIAGKSTTIFHILNTRVPAAASVLITAVRNAAVAALLSKLHCSPELQQQLVVIGNAEKLGGQAAALQLDRLVQQQRFVGDMLWLNAAFLDRCALQASLAFAQQLAIHVCLPLSRALSRCLSLWITAFLSDPAGPLPPRAGRFGGASPMHQPTFACTPGAPSCHVATEHSCGCRQMRLALANRTTPPLRSQLL